MIPYAGFHTGYKHMDLAPNEIITRIRLPRSDKQRRHYYRKVGTRRAQAISKVSFAGVAELAEGRIQNVRIALGSVAATVLRCAKTEVLLLGSVSSARMKEAQGQLAAEMSPVDDFRSNARYRTRVAQNLLAEFLLQL